MEHDNKTELLGEYWILAIDYRSWQSYMWIIANDNNDNLIIVNLDNKTFLCFMLS